MLSLLVVTALLQPQAINTLTPEEKKDGWKLLFDGKSLAGWRNYKQPKGTLGKGWVIENGTFVSKDPSNAGDIVTEEEFKWFELKVDFKLEKGQNSGIMFHVIEKGDYAWHSGPEIQIYDDGGEAGAQKTGYLYELYKPTTDVKAPVGEWNTFRIIVSGKGCATYLNGTKLYEYNLNSPEFKELVKKSKFSVYPEFGAAGKGRIAIQGDHGVVYFRNVKIKPLKD
jgi:cytochrome c